MEVTDREIDAAARPRVPPDQGQHALQMQMVRMDNKAKELVGRRRFLVNKAGEHGLVKGATAEAMVVKGHAAAPAEGAGGMQLAASGSEEQLQPPVAEEGMDGRTVVRSGATSGFSWVLPFSFSLSTRDPLP